MATRFMARTATKLGLILLTALAASGCGASARDHYFAARSIRHASSPGDSSVIAVAPGAADSSWAARLTFVPTAAATELVDGR